MSITSRPFRILADHMAVYSFLTEIYEADFRNGVAAPFLEYALSSDWMDRSFAHRWRIWQDEGRIVGFYFTENPATDAYFCLHPDYNALVDEMIAYAEQNLPGSPKDRRLVLFGAQIALREAASQRGWIECETSNEFDYFFDVPIGYPLPEGFRFTEPGNISVAKAMECCWKGFDNEAEEGPWNGDFESGHRLMNAPHATPEFHIAIENEHGEYVCYAGMWWTPENKLAYLEPLCTVPEYRGRGLAAAILSEMARRMHPLGALHMTGGCNPFYAAIGFKPAVHWTYWMQV